MTDQIAGYNTGDIVSGLQSLGLAAGDTAFVHSSLRSLGRVIRRSGEHCRGFLDVLGKEGTLAMPVFRRFFADGNDQIWGRDRSPSLNGWLSDHLGVEQR